jgi:hypothetical protein
LGGFAADEIADEIFTLSDKIRWVGLTTDRGDVLLNQMRPGLASYSPKEFDEEFVSLGPLTLVGVAEKYSQYLKGVEYVVVGFGSAICVYSRLGSNVVSVSLEKDQEALARYLSWLAKKRASMSKNK